MSTSSNTPDTPTPSTPGDPGAAPKAVAALAHTDENPHRSNDADVEGGTGWGLRPDDSECRTQGDATSIPPTSESLEGGEGSTAPDAPETAPDGPLEDVEDTRGSKEAAKYRRQLRAVEADRDALTARVEALQRQQVDAQVAALGVTPAAVWAAGISVTDLLGDDGTVDAGKVGQAVASVRETFGIGQPAKPRPRMFKSGASPASVPMTRPAWSSAFAPREGE